MQYLNIIKSLKTEEKRLETKSDEIFDFISGNVLAFTSSECFFSCKYK